jgi:hypothetical protein
MLTVPPPGVSVIPLTPPAYKLVQVVPDDAQALRVTEVEVQEESVLCG